MVFFFQVVFDSWELIIDRIADVYCIEVAFDKLVEEEEILAASLGAPLIQFKLIREQRGKGRLVFSMSHAVYDAISLGQIVRILGDLYNGSARQIKDFSCYVSYVQSCKEDGYVYWRRALQNSSMTTIPCISTLMTEGGSPNMLVCFILMPKTPTGITQTSFFTLACVSALSRLTGSQNVLFGRVVSDRATVPAFMANVVDPYLNRLPVRMQFPPNQTKSERLAELHKQCAESLAHETTDLFYIIKHCTDWPHNTKDFSYWIQYQNIDKNPVINLPGALGRL